jgi:hypothetical protein
MTPLVPPIVHTGLLVPGPWNTKGFKYSFSAEHPQLDGGREPTSRLWISHEEGARLLRQGS